MNPIRFIRTHVFDMTQQELAVLCGVQLAAVSKWETGRVTNPPLKTLREALSAEAARRSLPFSNDWLFRPPACEHCPNLPDTVCAGGCARIIAQCAAIRAGAAATDGSGQHGGGDGNGHAPPSATAPECVTGKGPAAIPAAALAPRQEAA